MRDKTETILIRPQPLFDATNPAKTTLFRWVLLHVARLRYLLPLIFSYSRFS